MMRELSSSSTVKSTTRWLLKKKRRRWSQQKQSTISTMLEVCLHSCQLSLRLYSTFISVDFSKQNWRLKRRNNLKKIQTSRKIIQILSRVSPCISMLLRLAIMWPLCFWVPFLRNLPMILWTWRTTSSSKTMMMHWSHTYSPSIASISICQPWLWQFSHNTSTLWMSTQMS